jgi:hypothetical protein
VAILGGAVNDESIPVLTLWQPWASLVALGVKSIETRSWSTQYRGPLAIHASTKRPPLMNLPPLWSRGEDRAAQERFNRETWHVVDTITDPAHQRPHRPKERVPRRSTTPTLFFPTAGTHGRPWDDKAGTSAIEQGTAIYLPLGAIVATCTLVDVVPILSVDGSRHGIRSFLADYPEMSGPHAAGLWVIGFNEWNRGHPELVEDQRPYGDFTPGRFAWLLADVVPVDPPVPFKGGQGLTKRWTPSVAA